MAEDNWWIMQQLGRERIDGFLAEAERDVFARQAGRVSDPRRLAIARFLRGLASRLDGNAGRVTEGGLAAAR